jgi:photosynthetic reaction center cytochrome c subunit
MSQIKSNTNHARSLRLCFFLVGIGLAIPALVGLSLGETATADVVPSSSIDTQDKAGQPVKAAEEVYKNIQVFKGLPASELEPTMAFISGSLGVKCNHCHVNPFDKDDKQTKQTARRMIRMVFDLNKSSFNGEKAVSCYTCHRGSTKPVSVPAVGQNLWQPVSSQPKETPLPTVDQVLDKYLQALGGAPALRKVTSRVAKGSRIGADGILVPEDVYQKEPNKILVVTTYPDVAFSTGFNGVTGWGASSKGGARELPAAVLAQLKNESEFYKEMKIKELYPKLSLIGRSKIGDNEVYVLEATPLTGNPEKLFFDARTGLLVRRYSETETILGMFPLQTDYSDFRDVDGIKQPFLIHWSMPGRIWGRKIVEMKQNVPVDDAQFNPPPPPAQRPNRD